MKKFTKRLTMVVAILLSLVLLTSSIVSTTLAKYVVAKSAQVQATLQKFGLTVKLESDKKDGIPVLSGGTASNTGDSVTLTYANVTLIPGDETYKNAMKASITGDANVAANVIITVDITCNDEAFTLSSANFDDYNTSKVYNPIEFYVAGAKTNTAGKESDTEDSNDVLAKKSESAIADTIVTKLNVSSTKIKDATAAVNTDGGYKVTGNIGKGTTGVAANNLDLGFVWDDKTNVEDEAEKSTWISNQAGATFTITYKITVEQA